MSLNPSNGIAARMNPGKTIFPNLARRVPPEGSIEIFEEVDAAVVAELKEAGINITGFEMFRKCPNGSYAEVPTSRIGELCMWGFTRRWYYYSAEGPGIPPDKAEEFHKTWGTQVRVCGSCLCPSPMESCHGFAIGSYHIDTCEGLKAFADLLKSIYIPGATNAT